MLSNERILSILGFDSKDFYYEIDNKNWIFSKDEFYSYSDYNKDICTPSIKINYKDYYDEECNEYTYIIDIYDNNVVKHKTIRVMNNLDEINELKKSFLFKENIFIFNDKIV